MSSTPHRANTPGQCPEAEWKLPPQPPVVLQEGSIQVWRIPLNPSAPWLESAGKILTPNETRRADRFLRAEHGRRFTVARAALRTLLAGYLDAQPSDLRLEQGPYGKPHLAGEHAESRVQFNVSHSGELAVAAFCFDRPIGVDIEQNHPRPDMLKIAKRFFAAQEVDTLLSIESEYQQDAFYSCWTRKEAYIKARGEGLHHPLKGFQVSLAPEDPPALLHADGQPLDRPWILYDLYPGDGYTGALAAQGPSRRVSCFAFQP